MRNRTITSLFAALLLSFLMVGSAAGQAPNTITYQGKLVSKANGDPITTATSVVFSLYAADQGGSPLWTETHSVTPDEGGIFTIELGTTSSLSTVLNGSKRYLGLRFGADAEMTPRQLITSTAYAYSAEQAEFALLVPDGSITGNKLASNSVSSAKITTGGVGNTDIASGAVTSAKLGADVKALLPIAMGWINSSGLIVTGSGNISCVWNATSTRYEITITGYSYYFNEYVTVVTGVSGDYTAQVGSVSGKLLVYFRNTAGAVAQPASGFQFVTYKP